MRRARIPQQPPVPRPPDKQFRFLLEYEWEQKARCEQAWAAFYGSLSRETDMDYLRALMERYLEEASDLELVRRDIREYRRGHKRPHARAHPRWHRRRPRA